MDANNFLNNLIKNIPQYDLSADDVKTVKFEGVEKFILNKINSSKFKASSIPDDLLKKVKENIKKSVAAKEPIHITFPFGGYKKWQLSTYPYPDWSEVFNLVLMREYLSPIAAGYENGVLLEYFSDEVFISRMNNYPQKDLDKYNEQFDSLVRWFSKYLPEKFIIKTSKIRDQISQEEILKRFDKEIVILKDKWQDLPNDEKEYRLRKTERNYKGDLSNLNKEEKDKILLESTMVHDAFIFGDWEKGVSWAFGEMMIPVGNRYTGSWGIHLRSSRNSTVQFWIGTGVLEERENKFIPTILTYEQFKDKSLSMKKEKTDVFDRSFPNLEEINIY